MLISKPFIEKALDKVVNFSLSLALLLNMVRKLWRLQNSLTLLKRKRAVLAISYRLIHYTGPIVKYPALCTLWLVTGAVVVTTANPALIGISLEFAAILLEED